MGQRVSTTVRLAAHVVRFDEWYDSKIPFLMAFICASFVTTPMAISDALAKFAQLTAFSTLYLAFGYMVNDYADVAVDRAAGKHKLISTMAPALSISLLAALAIVGIALLQPFFSRPSVLLVVLSSYLLAIAYSCRPFRFKERDTAGLVAASVAQRVMPIVVIGLILERPPAVMACWSSMGFLVGLRYILIHQHIDRVNDLRSGVRTFATIRPGVIERAIGLTLALEFAVLAIALHPLVQQHRWVLIASGAYGIFFVWFCWLHVRCVRQPLLTSYIHVPLGDLYFCLLPGLLLALLSTRHPLWLVPLGIHILGQTRTLRQYYSLPYGCLKVGLASLRGRQRGVT